jgi:hypothetical protein
MRSVPNSPSKEHREIIDARLASYRDGKSQPISIAELMRRVRPRPKNDRRLERSDTIHRNGLKITGGRHPEPDEI